MDSINYFAKNLKFLRESKSMEQIELAHFLGRKSSSSISEWEKGKYQPKSGILSDIASLFGVSLSDLMETDLTTVSSQSPTSQKINDVVAQLEEKRQEKVLTYSHKQLQEQNEEKEQTKKSNVLDFSETNEVREKPINAVNGVESLAAGIGYTYNEINEETTYYTDRDNLPYYNLASRITGDSMEPDYPNGDIALIQKGYDNIQGGVYAIDYDGKAFIKKLYNEGHQFRLVSINPKYDDIIIDVPVDEDIYFNIVGRVVDSFTPVER